MSPQRRGLRRFILASIVTASLAAFVTVLAAVGNADVLIRYTMMWRLCSDDPARRLVAVNYVYRQIVGEDPDKPKADDDPQRLATLARARTMLAEADDACFNHIVEALAAAGVWGENFGDAWVRYLLLRSATVGEVQRTYIAVELGKLLWRGTLAADERVVKVLANLAGDASQEVRLNAMSAIAAVRDEAVRIRLLAPMAGDAEPVVARRAGVMLALLGRGEMPRPEGMPTEEPGPSFAEGQVIEAGVMESVKRLAELEAMATNSADVVIDPAMGDLVLIEAVRVSRQSKPRDLMRVLRSEQPTLRDLAVHVAVERFGGQEAGMAAELSAVVLELIDGYEDAGRMGGAMLAGMAARDEKVMERLRFRAERSGDWVVKQHMMLALAMQGERVKDFDAGRLLLNRAMPPMTVVTAMLRMGRLEGMDWLMNPFGEPAVSLPVLMDEFRYQRILRRYLPQMPGVWLWADRSVQRFQADVVREWYLLMRPGLVWNAATQQFATALVTR